MMMPAMITSNKSRFSRAIIPALLFPAMLLSGCTLFQKPPLQEPYIPLRCQEIPAAEEGQRLCVMLTSNRGDLWFVTGRHEYAANYLVPELSFMPDGYGASSFGNFSISPQGRYLAVVTAEEGHPTLYIAPLQQILLGDHDIKPLPSLSVYPGSIGLEGWLDDDRLIISSDQDLARYRHGDELIAVRNYVMHLPDGRVTPAAPGMRSRM